MTYTFEMVKDAINALRDRHIRNELAAIGLLLAGPTLPEELLVRLLARKMEKTLRGPLEAKGNS
ncbi:MAG: hypothetical protein ACLQVY_16710 [Limisphaerales bacterium]